MAQRLDQHSDKRGNSFYHSVHVIAHDIHIVFDAINHSGGALFIYPIIGLLIFVISMAIRHGGGGGNGQGYPDWNYSPSSRSTGTKNRKGFVFFVCSTTSGSRSSCRTRPNCTRAR